MGQTLQFHSLTGALRKTVPKAFSFGRRLKSRLMRLWAQSFMILAFLAYFSATGSFAAPMIRVLIGEALKEVVITGGGLVIRDASGRTYKLKERATVTPLGEHSFNVNGVKIRAPGTLSASAVSGPLHVEARPYGGRVELRRNACGGLDVINVVDLEEYVWGVTVAEMPASWPLEALKAQAVAARTYALWKMLHSDHPYHVRATVMDQVYSGIPASHPRARAAVEETRGLVLTYRGKPILAYYHSCCGGAVDSAKSVKGTDQPYLVPGRCLWCRDCPHFSWEHRVAVSKARRLLSSVEGGIPKVDRLVPLGRTPGGRVRELEVRGPACRANISTERLREALGYGAIKSARFTVSRRGDAFHFKGRGFGHGLGACQWGMKGLAEKGMTWPRILGHYYKNVETARIRERPAAPVHAAAR
jgi:stage II sporulation protein D